MMTAVVTIPRHQEAVACRVEDGSRLHHLRQAKTPNHPDDDRDTIDGEVRLGRPLRHQTDTAYRTGLERELASERKAVTGNHNTYGTSTVNIVA
jgi:hypothetical protein